MKNLVKMKNYVPGPCSTITYGFSSGRFTEPPGGYGGPHPPSYCTALSWNSRKQSQPGGGAAGGWGGGGGETVEPPEGSLSGPGSLML